MQVKEIHIDSFGPLRDRSFELSDGLNVIEGKNESGKSTLAMFIKFMLYGLSGRPDGGELSERRRWVSWDTGSAAGYMVLSAGGRTYRIERELYVSFSEGSGDNPRERTVVTDTATGARVFRDKAPGEAILGITEQMFVNTVFVRQLGDLSVDGEGMTEAMENILMSGDEALSTRKAADRLDKSRKNLLYKNQSGGRIYELRREQYRLENELEKAEAQSGEIIEAEGAIADSEALIASRRQKAEYLSGLCRAWDALENEKKLDEAARCRASLERVREKLSAYDRYGDISEKCDGIRRDKSSLDSADMQLRTLRKSAAVLEESLPPRMTEDDRTAARDQVDKAEKLGSSRRRSFGWSLTLFILAAVCAVAAVIVRYLVSVGDTVVYAGLAAAGIMAVCGAICAVAANKALKKQAFIFDSWSVTDCQGLREAVAARLRAANLRDDPSSQLSLLTKEIQRSEAQRTMLISGLRESAALFADEIPDTDIMAENALERASELMAEINSLTREADTLSGRLSAMPDELTRPGAGADIASAAEQVRDTPEGKQAASMSEDEIKKARRDAEFFRSTAEAQLKRHSELEKRLSVLKAVSASPASLASKLDEIQRELDELTLQYDALVAAAEAIEKAGGSLRANLIPRVVSEAGMLMGSFTGGKYTGIGIDNDFAVTVSDSSHTRDVKSLSAGTRDAAYLCLRQALMNVLFQGDVPPAVYDESFAKIDEERLGRILALLNTSGAGGAQSLVFTCRGLESRIAGELTGPAVIRI